MAKRNYNVDKSERVKVSEEKYAVKVEVDETVRIVLLKDMTLKYTGPVTEKVYVFSGAGAEVDVNEDDAEIMLAKRGGQCCPGGTGPQPYFAKV